MKLGRAVRVLVATALASGLLAAASTSAFAGGVTRYVDDDGHAGPGCAGSGVAFKKIQKAVKASGPNDTVLVCAGTYRGKVSIGAGGSGLTIRGPNRGTATLLPPFAAPATAAIFDLVQIHNTHDVTIRGLRFAAPNETNCYQLGSFINVTQSTNVVIESDEFTADPEQDEGECGYRTAVSVQDFHNAAGLPDPTTATVYQNLIVNFLETGVNVGGSDNVSADVVANTIHYYRTSPPVTASTARPAGLDPAFDTQGVAVVENANANVQDNTIESATGVSITAASHPLLLGAGVALIQSFASVEADVIHNTIRRAYNGIYAQSVQAVVAHNSIRKVVFGIQLSEGSQGNAFRGNDIARALVGIKVPSTDAGGELFRNNTAEGSDIGCRDETTGSRTAGTNNTWTGNHANSDDPAGICPPAP